MFLPGLMFGPSVAHVYSGSRGRPFLTRDICSDPRKTCPEWSPAQGPGSQAGSPDQRTGEDDAEPEPELLWKGAESPGQQDTTPGNHTQGTCVYLYIYCTRMNWSKCSCWNWSSLQNDLSLLRSSSSEETLAVEEVLGSFDFLSHDFNGDDDTSCLGSMRLKDSGWVSR